MRAAEAVSAKLAVVVQGAAALNQQLGLKQVLAALQNLVAGAGQASQRPYG